MSAAVLALPAISRAAPVCDGEVRDVLPAIPLPIEAPQGIAVDEDGSLWICSLTSNEVIHLGPDLSYLGGFVAPFPPGAGTIVKVSGIALDPEAGTVFLVQPVLQEIWEFTRDGTPTGLEVPLSNLDPPPNFPPEIFPKGIEFDPEGAGGEGSIWVMEAVMTRVYEVALDGTVLRAFCDPLDPDGCPGKGSASPGSDIALVRDGSGAVIGFELLTGRSRRDRIVRVDESGARTGAEIPLQEVGGTPGGFARGRLEDPLGGGPRDVIFVTVESSAELHAIEVADRAILPMDTLSTTVRNGTVDLAWQSLETYDRIEVRREGDLLETLPGSARTFTDSSPPLGILDYAVTGFTGECSAGAAARAVVGPGQVLASANLSQVLLDAQVEPSLLFPCDLAEDAEENLWITDSYNNRLLIFTKELAFVTALEGPFRDEEDEMSAIAFNPGGDGGLGSFFVYNHHTNEVQELSGAGELIGERFPSGVFSDPDDEASVISMLYDPAGAGGEGSFWYLDFTRASIEEHGRDGSLIRACTHPDQLAEPPPDMAIIDAFTWGMTEVPGSAFGRFEVTGGRVRDLATTRIFELDLATCARTGAEVPVEGAGGGRRPIVLSIHRTTHAGRPVIFALNPSVVRPLIFELDGGPPGVPRVEDLTCVQESEPGPGGNSIRLAFRAPAAIDGVEVLRNGVLIASLPPDAAGHVDTGAPAGLLEYGLRCVRAGVLGEERVCAVMAGLGSMAAREFASPGAFLHQVAHDPVGKRYIAAGNGGIISQDLFVFGEDLKFQRKIPSPFRVPREVAAIAVRVAGGAAEVYCLGWNPGAAPGTQSEFPIKVLDGTGGQLREIAVTPPRPVGGFVSFPSGMAWDAVTDTFWYLERNAFMVVNMSPAGETLATFPHPARIHQDGVINYGIASAGARGVLYLSGAGRLDFEVTKLIEITLHGEPTGVEVPLGAGFYRKSWGFTGDAAGHGFVVASQADSLWDMVRYRAFAAVPPVEDASCAPEGDGVRLAWTNAAPYEAIIIYRGRGQAASIGGGETTWSDDRLPAPGEFYRVVASAGGLEGPGTVCVPIPPAAFVRGDVESNGEITITDAISILNFLFLGGDAPECLDAADVDDDAQVTITDGIALLGFLFLSGAAPAAPFPDPGYDRTPDATICRG